MCFEEMLETFNWSVDNDKEENIWGFILILKNYMIKMTFSA